MTNTSLPPPPRRAGCERRSAAPVIAQNGADGVGAKRNFPPKPGVPICSLLLYQYDASGLMVTGDPRRRAGQPSPTARACGASAAASRSLQCISRGKSLVSNEHHTIHQPGTPGESSHGCRTRDPHAIGWSAPDHQPETAVPSCLPFPAPAPRACASPGWVLLSVYAKRRHTSCREVMTVMSENHLTNETPLEQSRAFWRAARRGYSDLSSSAH